MEKLTNGDKEIPTLFDNAEYWLQMYFKLKDYENLEEQGRLIKLHYKDVYFIVDINNPRYAAVMKRPIRELAIYEIESIDKENCKYFSTEEKAEKKWLIFSTQWYF